MDREDFARSLRDAVEHLYNRSYLTTHPLAESLGDGRAPLSGDQVRRALLDAIEQLKPVGGATPHEADWRRYRHLILRYVEGQTLEQIADRLGVSIRQASRDNQRAFAALTALFWARRRGRDGASARSRDATEDEASEGDDGTNLAIEAAKVAASEQSVSNLAETLDGVLATLARLASERGVSFDRSVPDTLPPVAISPTLLRQAVLNLLIYTCELIPGGRAVLVGADTARGVAFRVLRDGQGRPPPTSRTPTATLDARHLFDAARQLLEAQGGSVESGDGESGDLLLRLVLPPILLRKVLVVDDNPDVVGLFRRFLRDEPYRLIQATSGLSAVRLGRELLPDAIILDVMIPAQDGWNILQQLRDLPETAETPIVVCSVLPERALALSLGIDEFLAKPVTRAALLATLARCCSPRAENRARS
ncbi:MAG: response regulator [Candidatus Dormibacteraceae bacterium]